MKNKEQEQVDVCFKIGAATLANAETAVRQDGMQLSDYVIHTIEILAAKSESGAIQ